MDIAVCHERNYYFVDGKNRISSDFSSARIIRSSVYVCTNPLHKGIKLSKISAETTTAAAASASSGVTWSTKSDKQAAIKTAILRNVSANTCYVPFIASEREKL
jgi:hypothetical protein